MKEPDATAGRSPVIKVTHLTKRFSKETEMAAVNDLSFEVHEREVVSLFGPSGCGKTTTLRCIAGLERPDSGEISIGGVTSTSVEKGVFVPPEKRGLGFVFQSYALWPHMKVYDNVAYGLKVRHVPGEEVRKRVDKALDVVDLTGYNDRYPSQLSGGQQQRVAVARSIVYEPKALLMDEPLSNLDAKVREKTRIELSLLLRRVGVATVYVTHDQEEAFQLSDQIVVMNDGRKVQTGKPIDIYTAPATGFVASFVGKSNLIPGTVKSSNGTMGHGRGTVEILGGYELRCDVPPSFKAGDRCLVMVRPNEIGIHAHKPQGSSIPCKLVSRSYRGALTDHIVKVGDVTLTVSSHRFCGLEPHYGEQGPQDDTSHYLVVHDESAFVLPPE